MSKKNELKKDGATFESSIERLEAIVGQMESDKLPLEELLARYEEGVKLVKLCTEKLEEAGRRMEIITRDANGNPETAEFDAAKKNQQTEEKDQDVRLF
jgi:exodeoxyribonuclease VII small subunit